MSGDLGKGVECEVGAYPQFNLARMLQVTVSGRQLLPIAFSFYFPLGFTLGTGKSLGDFPNYRAAIL